MAKTRIGLAERIIIEAPKKAVAVMAKVDTGASNCSIDENLARKLELGPAVKRKLIKNAEGSSYRSVIRVPIVVHGKRIVTEFTLANRANLRYRALLGVNALKNNFIIDPDLGAR